MTPDEFVTLASTIYEGHGWQSKLAREIGVSAQTPSNWAHGRHPVPTIVARFLELKKDNKGD